LSYIVAKRKALKVAASFKGNLSPFNSQLVLFGPPEITPSWAFRAEYSDLMTGSTFDVYVSLLGEVIKIPPKSEFPK
jgi:hypothetical protein